MNDSVDVKRHVYLRTIAKLKVHAEFFFGDSVAEVGSNTSTLVSGIGIPPEGRRVVSPWILPSGGGWFNPGITHNFPDMD